MAAVSAQLAKSFLHASNCRRTSLHRPLFALSAPSRRWNSAVAPSSSATLPEAQAAPAEDPPKRKKPGRKPKIKVEEEEGEEVVIPVVKRRSKIYDKLPDGTVAPTKKKKAVDPNITHISKQELPPLELWAHFFPYTKETQHRTTIQNPETARMIAEALIPEGSKDKIIIDAYPGAGQLSRALLALPKERIKKLIIIEDAVEYLPFLEPLEGLDPRVKLVRNLAKQWSTYKDMEDEGILSEVKTLPWENVHEQLHFIMQTPTDTHGEQLVAQLLRAVPDRQWLFQYGRVPMSFILTQRMWERIKALPDTHIRCKVSVMAQAVATLHEAVPPESLQPYSAHFFPQRTGSVQVSESVITVTPKAEPLIPGGDLDFWDYCLRKLFVMRATSLEKCIGGLGPGAKNMLPGITDPTLPEEQRLSTARTPRELDLREWALVVNAFKNWPFRPMDLGIDSFNAVRRN
ncbi:S-adenosyl-L-methionine-dependent methyltransferase [Pholiota molesta]|nr:S-adenosyl-L-methionine-dependent methyltransferase [Pholiota molesta]